ncbi:bifunctional adenosylcobinamide kinase/adenosylcobinamide-phosphate guanylyltransferase [Roseivivax sp. CAU 1761]
MAKSILITGGARSGKSALAEARTLAFAGRALYLATSPEPGSDAEMAARIAAHRARRGTAWEARAVPLALTEALRDSDAAGLPRLVDCLTLWLSNLMLAETDWRAAVDELAAALPGLAAPVVLVSNEVGAGIVPETPLGRRFRDAAGEVNQQVAAACDEVWLAVAGQPLRLKPAAHPFLPEGDPQ